MTSLIENLASVALASMHGGLTASIELGVGAATLILSGLLWFVREGAGSRHVAERQHRTLRSGMTSQSPFRVNKASSVSETAVTGLVLIRRNDGIVLPEDYQTELLRDAIMSTSFNSFATTGLVAALSLAAVSVDAMAWPWLISDNLRHVTGHHPPQSDHLLG